MNKKYGNSMGFAVVGLGNAGKIHMEAIEKARGASLAAVCDSKIRERKGLKLSNDIKVYEDYFDVLKDDDVDVVAICTPSGMHTDMIISAARAGKHVLCEKPLGISVSEVDSAIKECNNAGIILGCIFQERLLQVNKDVKNAVTRGDLGKIVMANARILWYRSDAYYKDGGWRGTWNMDGGGSLMNQSIHTIDLLQWMAGPVKSVYAKGGVFAHDIESEDLCVATVTYENGAIGSITGTTCAYPGLSASIELVGTNGTIITRDGNIDLWEVKANNGQNNSGFMDAKNNQDCNRSSGPALKDISSHILQTEDMAEAVKNNKPPCITGESGKNAIAIICAIYESIRTNKEVFV